MAPRLFLKSLDLRNRIFAENPEALQIKYASNNLDRDSYNLLSSLFKTTINYSPDVFIELLIELLLNFFVDEDYYTRQNPLFIKIMFKQHHLVLGIYSVSNSINYLIQ